MRALTIWSVQERFEYIWFETEIWDCTFIREHNTSIDASIFEVRDPAPQLQGWNCKRGLEKST